MILKLWQARDTFDPARLMQKFADGRAFDWDDLRQLLNRAIVTLFKGLVPTDRWCKARP